MVRTKEGKSMNFKGKMQRKSGITLIALVITIIVLLILAGVTIATLTGDNGILTRANEVKIETEEAKEDELRKLTALEATTNLENKEYVDSDGNKAIIPAGFAVSQVEGEKNVNTGLVIIDSNENEFVWIPVGNVSTKNNNIETIELNRYTFPDGIPHSQNQNAINTLWIEEETSNYDNSIALNINDFIESANINNGYYIARYEASYGKAGSDGKIKAESKISSNFRETEETPNSEGMLWNFITQPDAALACRNIYNTNKFKTDLMNSYAWDTAILFIQKFSNDSLYSIKTDGSKIMKNTGKTGDKVCNIFDMSGNLPEWTTETYTGVSGPCVFRGGSQGSDQRYTSQRDCRSVNDVLNWITFRAILYF